MGIAMIYTATPCARDFSVGSVSFERIGFQMNALKFLLCILCVSSSALGDDSVEGKVTRIIDGDSILVTDGKGVEYEVQLEGIDAPEPKQDFGKEATDALSKWIKDKSVKVTWKSKDNFDRVLAQVYEGEKHINMEMLKSGMAWHFKRYNKEETLAKAEAEAKEAKKGLWAKDSPKAPWDYRKENKTPEKPLNEKPIKK
jgi:micrococcal nuclease